MVGKQVNRGPVYREDSTLTLPTVATVGTYFALIKVLLQAVDVR